MAHNWNKDRTDKRLAARYKDVEAVEVRDYSREMSLDAIPVSKAYRINAAHVYIDILNVAEILDCTQLEGETCHKRTLRFLNQHYRAVHRILADTHAVRVDFHNQRLHAIVAKPYADADESKRIATAVAIAQLAIDILAETGNDDEQIASAKIRVGIDTGLALAVNNGRPGGREPLFLGAPANRAAHCASAGRTQGIFLTNTARAVMGFPVVTEGRDQFTALTSEQVAACVKEADLDVSKDSIIKEWRKELSENPIGSFELTRPTPPLSNLEFADLNASSTKHFEGVSVYADIDGFTNYVQRHLNENTEDLVRVLHVLRSELDAVIESDFGGRRVRFIGDCLHGVLLEGTSRATDAEATISTATLCAGALRSGFERALAFLEDRGVDVHALGLAIGFDFGPLSLTRLGMKGDKVRCSTGRAVGRSEDAQKGCTGKQSAIGEAAFKSASGAIKDLFGASRRISGLTYDTAVETLDATGDRIARAIYAEAVAQHMPAVAPSLSSPMRPHTAG